MKLMKNNLKLMFRCKPLVLIVICMVMVTGMLSAVFKDFMTDSYELDEFMLGLSFEPDCVYTPMSSSLQTFCADEGIGMIDLMYGEGQKAVENGTADVVAEFTNDGCVIYSDSEHEAEAGFINTTISSIFSIPIGLQLEDYIQLQTIDVQPMPDSQLYYTVAYTVYFVWCAMVVLGVVMSSERKNKIGARFRTTPVSSFHIYLSRFIPTTLMIILLIFTSVVICTFLFGIQWLEIPMTALILLLGCIAAAALGTVLFSLIKNVMLTVVLGFCLLMFWGFFGGSFCPYMWEPWAAAIQPYSPIYYMNRSLVELNTGGSSEFTAPALLILVGMTVVCIPLGMAAVRLGKES